MIRVDGLAKRYGRTVAVDGLSFAVEPGETFALIGPNGAGKTTTLKVLLGLVRPDAGRVLLGPNGLSPSDPAARAALGYVPQRVEFAPGRTVRDVLGFYAALRGLDGTAVTRALLRVGMEAFADRKASELSGGYTQRLSLAQALLGEPGLLVLDEPTASLDPQATWEFRSLVEQLRREGRTILLCSHLLSEVERVADRVLILVAGRQAALESIADLRVRQAKAARLRIALAAPDPRALRVLEGTGLAHEALDDVTLVVDGVNGNALAALDALRSADIGVRSFELVRPTLEDLFLDAVSGGAVRA
jgi:ABC-type multidrug transport system ATPase subunit